MSRGKYDHEAIAQDLDAGLSWDQVATKHDVPKHKARKAHGQWRYRHGLTDGDSEGLTTPVLEVPFGGPRCECESYPNPRDPDKPDWAVNTQCPVHQHLLDTARMDDPGEGARQVQSRRIRSLAELLEAFQVNLEDYGVHSFRVNQWEQHSAERGVVPLYQVKATIVPRKDEGADPAAVAARVWEEMREDFRASVEGGPGRPPRPDFERKPAGVGDPVLMEVVVNDPHLGMMAWGKEVGEDYDSAIMAADYGAAVEHLLGWASVYNVERILFLAGNDFFHVDHPAMDPRGGSRGGATTKGTAQDVDSRLAKMFRTGRQILTAGIDAARALAPVDVQVVLGNHDRDTMFKMGELLDAWYRHDPAVMVFNSPRKRVFYDYGQNLFMFTHGEAFNRKRDNLVSVMATEAPPELWAGTTVREIHAGHNHRTLQKAFVTGDFVDEQWEGRSVRLRSLPGLTATDAWHYEEGYKHRRAATVLFWYRDGGLAGYHDFTL